MTPRFRRRSKARIRAVPVPLGDPGPKPGRAARAGFGPLAGDTAEVLTKKHRLLLVRCGPDEEEAGALAAARLARIAHIAIDARTWSPEAAARFAAGAVLRAWRFHRLLSRPDPARPILSRLDILVDDPDAARAAWASLEPGVAGALFARDLVVEPGNELTPATFAAKLGALRGEGLEVEILEPPVLEAEGFGGLLAVGRASANPPRLAILRWPGAPGTPRTGTTQTGTPRAASLDGDTPPVMLVGKGITFDTGGVCIKPAQGLWDMRADMAGAAACAGAMLALARRNATAPVVALLPLAENAIGDSAYRPGDVLRMTNGTTVEVVDTDAEGRLVLADALAWGIDRFKPRAVIDLATLTGSIVVALGLHMAGLFASDDVLATAVAAAGATVDERVWRMPLDPRYAEDLRSDIADRRHCTPTRMRPDCCLAAAFLHAFTDGVPWAHLDIAGVESHEKATDRHPAGPTAWGARLLDRLVATHFATPPDPR